MAHRQKIQAFVVSRTDRKNPADKRLVFGAPGALGTLDLNNHPFITNDARLATLLRDEMHEMHGDTQIYAVEPRDVRI